MPIIAFAVSRQPIAAILVVYWLQLMIIGFFNAVKLAYMARWLSILVVPMFCVIYFGLLDTVGLIAKGMVGEQMQGSDWYRPVSSGNYAWHGALFFIAHGFSFYYFFIRCAEYKRAESEDVQRQLVKALLRVIPMWLVALVGAVITLLLRTPNLAVLLMVPAKILLDVLGHRLEHAKPYVTTE